MKTKDVIDALSALAHDQRLKELDHAGLVTARQDGHFVIYSANYKSMNALVRYLTENCCESVACAS